VPKPVRKKRLKGRLEALDRRVNKHTVEALRRRVNHYGGSTDWQALKQEVFKRDRWRCIYPGCTADHLKTGVALECAHLRGVQMGGRREGSPGAIDHPMWLATICHQHHIALDQQGGGHDMKRQIMARLSEKYGYSYGSGAVTATQSDTSTAFWGQGGYTKFDR